MPFISAEDADDDTIKPRLMAAGADGSRIHSMTAIKLGDEERPITFPDDLPAIER